MNKSHDSESHRESEFISTRHHLHYILQKRIKNGSGAGVTVNGMSGTEGQDPGGSDPIDLQLTRGATGNSREQSTQQSTVPITRLIDTESLLQVTPYQGVNDHVVFLFLFHSLFPFFFSNFFFSPFKKLFLLYLFFCDLFLFFCFSLSSSFFQLLFYLFFVFFLLVTLFVCLLYLFLINKKKILE